ncbi:MAG: LysM peptidoglycan-binding domain-containing protein [Flavobacteriales bacterium]|nr:LysM peptidoglycan-binding domain-containing protein [Flavobacteriales bacterium]
MQLKIKSILLVSSLLFVPFLFAQETVVDSILKQDAPKISFLDSIKKTFVHHEVAACVDERWFAEFANQDLFKEMINDIENINLDEKVDFDLPTEVLKKRLAYLDSKSAFNIEYNAGLENLIKHYLKNRKKSFERLMGIAQFYFPMYEAALSKHNVPLEIKYLSIVESALNPKAVSRVGATGLWQFMYYTGKEYGLDITTYVDERSDPLLSTEAACEYMKRMYGIFGDWDLVLASYNAGPGNVSKAIRRSGGKQNYWNIRPFLPKETQGYVPAFLATMYVMEFHKEHGIVPQKAVVNPLATDTIRIKNKMTFKQIADLLDVSEKEIEFLNPSYKRGVVPNIDGKKHYLRLPLEKLAVFISNEDKMYAYANYDFNRREKPYFRDEMLASRGGSYDLNTNIKFHKVRRGENLSTIARKYGVTVSEIKRWNGLKSNAAKAGANLKIEVTERVPSNTAVAAKTAPKNNQTKDTVSDKISKENEERVAIVKAEKGLSPIDTITQKKPKFIAKEHVVSKDDNLYTLSRKYGASVDDLKQWNQLETDIINVGKTLVVCYDVEVEEVETAQEKLEKSLATITPVEKTVKNKDVFYVVKKGDTLIKISQIKGVSITDLKKWNGIDGSKIKPGMKLKIKA